MVFLSACGGGSSSGFITPPGLTTFDGTWSEGCDFNQSSGEADLDFVTIDGAIATFNRQTYDNDSCTGTPTDTASTSFRMIYPGSIALSDCFNGEKINATLIFPITINDVSLSEDEFNALSSLNQAQLSFVTNFDLLCTNQEKTILYSGDESTGSGISDATRPTSADLSSGLDRV